MGVDFATVTGFGFVLSRDELEACLRKLGIEWDHDEPEYELEEHYHVRVSHCGSAYVENGIRYLFHAEESRNAETGTTTVDQDHVAALKRMIEECGLDKTVAFQEEEYVY